MIVFLPSVRSSCTEKESPEVETIFDWLPRLTVTTLLIPVVPAIVTVFSEVAVFFAGEEILRLSNLGDGVEGGLLLFATMLKTRKTIKETKSPIPIPRKINEKREWFG